MALSKRCLKGLIEYSDLRNFDGFYGENDVMGVSTDKRMFPTRADLDSVNLHNYKLLSPGSFAYVADTSRRGNKVALAYNDTDKTYIVSTWYVVFKVCDCAKKIIIPEYLFLYFNRVEFDRYARTNSWGSAREYFWFEDMENIEIEIPDLPTQQKYVSIYKAMVANQQAYERGLEDLKLTCDALIDKVKHTAIKKAIRELLAEVDNRNDNGTVTNVQGINIEKQFMPSVADITGVDLKKYKLVQNGQFAFSGMQTGRDKCVRIALYREEEPIVISPAYTVFETKDTTVSPEYIMIWFSRMETDRRGWFMSDSSIRTNLDLDRFYEIEIPVPDEKMQKAIVDIYTVYTLRRNTNEQLKKQIKDICPILIRGSLEDGGEPNGEPA